MVTYDSGFFILYLLKSSLSLDMIFHITLLCLYKNKIKIALAGVAQWTECQAKNQRVTCSIPREGTYLGCGPGPQLGACNLSHTDVSLPFFLPPFPSF